MIKPAVLMVWPKHLDFPVARWNLTRFKDYFESINIAFSDHYVEEHLENFVKAKLPFANFIDVERSRGDWRDDAVNCLLDKVQSEYVCFMEQDFLIKDETFFEKVFQPLDFIYYKEGERIHPAFAVVKRSLIDKTSRNFSAQPPGDHFYVFFNELPQGTDIETLGVKRREDFFHVNGLSQNYRNFQYGDPFYQPINFLYFNYKSLQFPDQHQGFRGLQEQINKTYGHTEHHTYLDNFFPNEKV